MFGKEEEPSIMGKLGFQTEKSSSGRIVDSISSVVPTFQEEPACAQCCPKLTYTQRLIGFGSCCGLGYVMSLAGTLTLIGGPTSKNVATFAVLYVLGNVIALCATGFLLGPKSQCIKMWDPSRRFTTAFYLAMLIIVFAVAVAKQHVALVLVLLFIQILAGIWYTASYIPFAQKMIIAFFKNTLCKPCFDAASPA